MKLKFIEEKAMKVVMLVTTLLVFLFVGSILYKVCIQLAISAGLPANLLKLITAVLFLIILVAGGRKNEDKHA